MKCYGFLSLLALCFVITNVDAYSSRRGGFFVDIGGLAGCFKGKEKHDCMDIGFVGTEGDVFRRDWKDTESIFIGEHCGFALYLDCDPSCSKYF